MIRVTKIFSVIALLFIVLMPKVSALQSSSPVTLTVPDTVLELDGHASPNALVTIKEGGTTIGTTTADGNGAFTLALGSQAIGIRTITLTYNDAANKTAASYTKQVSVQSQQTTTISAFLAPTINRLTAVKVRTGSIAQINGYTVPYATVTLSLGISEPSRTASANASGYYEFLLDTSSLASRTYEASVVATKAGLGNSQPSNNITFTVLPRNAPAQPDLVVLPNKLSPPVSILPQSGTKINGDTVVITGEAAPYAQIVVYQNGVAVGSVAADKYGNWQFRYTSHKASVTFRFQACIDGTCSVQTKPFRYYFSLPSTCSVDFALQNYRFWNIPANSAVTLRMIGDIDIPAVAQIDWGDETKEKFNQKSNQRNFTHTYQTAGQYNGRISFSTGECVTVRYFSVNVVEESFTIGWFWLTSLLVTLGAIGLIIYVILSIVHKL